MDDVENSNNDVNNDSFILGDKAANFLQEQPQTTANVQKISRTVTGERSIKQNRGEAKKQKKFEKFKEKVIKKRKMKENGEKQRKNNWKRQPRENARYCVQNPPQINKKGVEVSNIFGGRVKESVNCLVKNVLDKVNWNGWQKMNSR